VPLVHQDKRGAVTDAAAELGSGHAEHVAQHPWESGVVDIDGVTRTIDFDLERDG